jgi:hypothetical protein
MTRPPPQPSPAAAYLAGEGSGTGEGPSQRTGSVLRPFTSVAVMLPERA